MMKRSKAVALGIGIGSALMYLIDPDRGKRRRALVQDKFRYLLRKTNDCIEVTSRDFRNRARGIAAQLNSVIADESVMDEVLVDRVRAKLGRVTSHPRAIEVTAHEGNLRLSGPVLEHEVDAILRCVNGVTGVKTVENALEVHKTAEDHPALQGGRERPGYRFEFMQENWSPAARVIAGAAGASLAVYGGTRRDALGYGMGVAGLLLLARGLVNSDLKRLTRLGNGSENEPRIHNTQSFQESMLEA